jgi:hypothetical protein
MVNGLKRSRYFLTFRHVNQFSQGHIDGLLSGKSLATSGDADSAWRTCRGRRPSTWKVVFSTESPVLFRLSVLFLTMFSLAQRRLAGSCYRKSPVRPFTTEI